MNKWWRTSVRSKSSSSLYLPWEGYNYEDAILVNERLVQEDLFTSIHIEKFDLEIRQTTFGVEKITRDLPNVNDDAVSNLDSNGIVCKGGTFC